MPEAYIFPYFYLFFYFFISLVNDHISHLFIYLCIYYFIFLLLEATCLNTNMLHANARIVLSVTLLHSYFLSSAVPFHNSLRKKSSADPSGLDPDLGHMPKNTDEAALEYYKQFLVDGGDQGFPEDDYEHAQDYEEADQYQYPVCTYLDVVICFILF